MIEALFDILKTDALPLLQDSDWTYQQIYEIDAPHSADHALSFDRIWRPIDTVPGSRLYFHAFPEVFAGPLSKTVVDVYPHGHPWPMACINLGPGRYMMRLTCLGRTAPIYYAKGSAYALLAADLEHDIATVPGYGPVITAMLTGPGWGSKSWTSDDLTLIPSCPEEALLDQIRTTARQRIETLRQRSKIA